MNARTLTMVFLALWLIAFAGAFLAFWLTPARDFGLTAGLNRVSTFFGWQVVAGLMAVLAWTTGSRLEKGTGLRRLSRVPFALFAALVAAILVLILYVNFSKPDPAAPPPPSPVTQPAEPVPDAPPTLPEKPSQ